MRFMHPFTLGCLGLALALGLSDAGIGQGKKDPKTGEVNTPPAKGERVTTKLRPGDPAPDFLLPDVKKTKEVKLSSFKDKKPVVLIFGSYT
ncbi:MAG: hypothetical protein HYR84_02590 [Planctomycetes bacterium]|nr:hypothetical protein [Planctomycetota bacterium]